MSKTFSTPNLPQIGDGYDMHMNLDAWHELSPAEQQVVIAVGHDTDRESWDHAVSEDTNMRKTMENAGMQIVAMPPEDIDAWRNKPEVQGILDDYLKSVKAKGLPGTAVIDAVFSYWGIRR